MGLQLAIFQALLWPAYRDGAESRRPAALGRWLTVTVAVNAVIAAGAIIYVVALRGRHGGGFAWIAPPLGGVLGTAIGLQVTAARLARLARG